ncbi:MAG TPA: 50S ribosomal protein L9 [Tenuifilum sp.]|jgi:large subunit ribosomal protein L9|uniref:50S ribosomal protein L9 n=1 Tax=Tenuifilum sp. TaxID=2760880 RepID=UPI000A9C45D8|nr:50S ribosomal protein L9 [Bacteroidales bacterium]HOU75097.1 50S ribosomal protein L9 [Tenuifilum sp.]MBP9028486.1 50S ribosomal protein L9 [Bacteroidales bacterium]HQI89517.1 50S ribosomal protein L9 [Tenuifilum sp.]HRR12053.1 50S ribosomal protein L9 [Tenuifilum sp.]
MEIILLQDVPNLGNKNDVVTVRNGYARNYLIPRGMAVTATESAKKVIAENIKQQAHKEAKIKAEAEQLAKKLEGVKLTIGAKTSSTGKIFGSVNNIQIAEALAAKGFEIDRKSITLSEDQVKEVGTYKAEIKLHREVKVSIEFEVVSE